MISPTFSELIPDYRNARFSKSQPSGLAYDSRHVRKNFVFFAIPGVHVDGHAFIDKAVEMGATYIVCERDPETPLPATIAVARVADCRKALSYAAALWFDRPAEKLKVMGVTGTDGKSSTTYFIQQLLEAAGLPSGFFSTVAYKTGDQVESNNLRQSTPEALELHKVLADMLENGKKAAVVEATSHGLSPRTARLADVPFQIGVFTNLTHEHLEFHGSFEQYAADKSNLFKSLKPRPDCPAVAVINAGDPRGEYMAQASSAPVLRYFAQHAGLTIPERLVPDLLATAIHPVAGGFGFRLRSADGREASVCIPLAGSFNVDNMLAALLAASQALGTDPFKLLPYVQNIKPVKGRMETVNAGQKFTALVDYAHTPGAYEKVLPALRVQAGKGRLILVFGSAGERDTTKRPLQGALAARHADVLFLTEEDPRLEDPDSITAAIRQGALDENPKANVQVIRDRSEAVYAALKEAKDGDLVAFLGKGHEQCIIRADGRHPYDEALCVQDALKRLGYSPKEA